MGGKSARVRRAEPDQTSDADRNADGADSIDGDAKPVDRSPNASAPDRAPGRGEVGINAAATASPMGRRAEGGTVPTADSGSEGESLDERYNMEVTGTTAGKLQRLEAEFGRDRVSDWVEEGMTVGTMGKPRDMRAFRERQDDRPDAVPTDVERRIEASRRRNATGSSDDGPAGETRTPDAVRKVVSSQGQSLDGGVQREMESKMGDSFDDVQIHTGPKAADAADSINARAFTVGNHVAFNDGEYQPDTESGREVIAHELTHVRQQTGGRISVLPKEAGIVVDPDPQQEKEAERVAAEVTSADENRAIQRYGTEVHVQRLPDSKTSAPSAGGAGATFGRGGSIAVQRDTSAEASSESGGETVATHHTVSAGENLKQIADSYNIEDWKKIWYLNGDAIDDVPKKLFEGTTIAIPEDESSVPDKGWSPKLDTFHPAEEMDLRVESKDASEPTGSGGKKAGVEAEPKESQVDPTVEPETEESGNSEGAEGLTISSSTRVNLEQAPEAETASPSSVTEDQAFQQAQSEVTSEVSSTVEEDITGGTGEALSPDHAGNAQAASRAPGEEKQGMAGEQKLGKTGKGVEESGSFDLEAFEEQFMARIKEATPDSMEAMENYEDNEPLDKAEEQIRKDVDEQHEKAAGPVEQQAAQQPDTGAVETGETEQLEKPDPGDEPTVDREQIGNSMATKPKSEEEVLEPFEKEKEKLEQPRKEAGFDEEDGPLSESPNEEFRKAGEAKEEVETKADEAPEKYRQAEKQIQQEAEEKAVQKVEESSQQVHQKRDETLTTIAQQKESARGKDEQARQAAWAEIQSIYEETDRKVNENLDRMDEAKQTALDRITERRKQFEAEVTDIADSSEGWWSAFTEAIGWNEDFTKKFERRRDQFIDDVQNDILNDLITTVGECMENIDTAIEEGRQKIDKKKQELKEQRDDISEEAFNQIDQKFNELDQTATQQTEQLSDDVTQAYEAELQKADEHMREEKKRVEESREGIWSWFTGIWEDIIAIKNMISRMASDAAAIAGELMPPWQADFSVIWDNLMQFTEGTFDHITENFGDIMLDGLLKYLDLGLMAEADLDLPSDGFDSMWDFAKFLLSMLKAVFGGMVSYVSGRAEDVWSGDTIKLTGSGEDSAGLTVEQVQASSIIDESTVKDEGGNKTLPLANVLEMLWGAGEAAMDWIKKMGDLIPTIADVASGEKPFSALLELDTLKTVLKPVQLVGNLIVNALVDIVGKGLAKQLAGLLGPAAAVIKLAKKIYDLVMFIIDEAAGMAAVVKGYVEAAHGMIVSGNVSRAMEIFQKKIPTMVATLISFIMSMIGAAGRASNTITDAIKSAKGKMDKGIDKFLSSQQDTVAEYAPTAVGVIAKATDALVTGDDEKSQSSGSGDGDKSGDGKGDKSGDGTGTGSSKSGTAGDKTGSSGDGESTYQELGKKADRVADRVERMEQSLQSFSNIDSSWREAADNFRIEEKMRAVDSTVAAEESGISESRATHVLEVSGLTDVYDDANGESGGDLPTAAFVAEYASKIRSALVRGVADLVGSPVGEVWDEGSNEWKYDHNSIAGEYAKNKAEQHYEDVGADTAAYLGGKAVEESGGRDTLGEKMDRLRAEQELRNRVRTDAKKAEMLKRLADAQNADQPRDSLDPETRVEAHLEAYDRDIKSLEEEYNVSVDRVLEESDTSFNSVTEQRAKNLEQTAYDYVSNFEGLVSEDKRKELELYRALHEPPRQNRAERLEALGSKWQQRRQNAEKITASNEQVLKFADTIRTALEENNRGEYMKQMMEAQQKVLDEKRPDVDWVRETMREWKEEIVEGSDIDINSDEYEAERSKLVTIAHDLEAPYDDRFVTLLQEEYGIDIERRVFGTGSAPEQAAGSD